MENRSALGALVSSILSTLIVAGCAAPSKPPTPALPAHVSAAAAPASPSVVAATTSPPAQGSIDIEVAHRYFAEFDEMCTADAGGLWGRTLCGPLLFVDPASRQIVTSVRDSSGALSPRGSVFVGRWPDEMGIANHAVDWQGTRWTMVMWGGLDGDSGPRRALMMHEAFHRLQPDLKLEPKNGELNNHLDSRDGRLWLELEWNALQAALSKDANDPARSEAIADALTFRAKRRARFPDAARREPSLEIAEGLAEYTGTKLAGSSNESVIKAAIARRGWTTSFVRGFAYVSGPLYGFLLDGTGAEWRKHVTLETDLGTLLAELAKVKPRPLAQADKLADKYDGVAVRKAEDERARTQAAQIAEWKKALVDGPVLVVDKKGAQSSFDPNKVYPLGETQSVCTQCTFIAKWGTLAVEKGAMLRDDKTDRAFVSLERAAPDSFSGKGWTLTLAPGWSVTAGERKGDLRLLQKP